MRIKESFIGDGGVGVIQWGVESILKLAQEHKEKCNGFCNISMFCVLKVVEKVAELTDEEREVLQ